MIDTRTKVLVVDDEPTLRLGFAYALNGTMISAETAANGFEALERVAGDDFSVLLLDLRMPELDGLSVIERMRQEGNRTPVILCSAFITIKAAICAIRHNVVDFLMKPVKPNELRQAVASVLRPGSGPLALALAATRRGDIHEAIKVLESVSPEPESREMTWLTLLRLVTRKSDNLDEVAEMLPDNLLERLAFQSSSVE